MIYFYISFHFLQKPINYDLFQKIQYWFICFWFRHSCSTVGDDHLLLQWNQLLFFFGKIKISFLLLFLRQSIFCRFYRRPFKTKNIQKWKKKETSEKIKDWHEPKRIRVFHCNEIDETQIVFQYFCETKGKMFQNFYFHSIAFSVRFCYPIFLL